jgi:hypothetical protein
MYQEEKIDCVESLVWSFQKRPFWREFDACPELTREILRSIKSEDMLALRDDYIKDGRF